MINLSRLFGRFDKRKQIEFADSTRTQVDRREIDEFLAKVLPEGEREYIDSYFISDEASILDCSMAEVAVLQKNCNAEYGVSLSKQELRMPLYILMDHVKALRS